MTIIYSWLLRFLIVCNYLWSIKSIFLKRRTHISKSQKKTIYLKLKYNVKYSYKLLLYFLKGELYFKNKSIGSNDQLNKNIVKIENKI